MSTKKLTERQKAARRELAKRKLQPQMLKYFIEKTFPKKRDKDKNILAEYNFTPFHEKLIKIIQYFIDGKIKNLMISVPPQHGKSEISTRRLIPFLIGQDPSRKIALTSFSTTRAARFGGEIKGIMATPEYKQVFPTIILPDRKDRNFRNTSEYVDVPVPDQPGQRGNLFFVGRGGGLAGDPVDYLIMDDIYKNAEEANSPVIRQSVIDWYDSVADARLHNDSQKLIVTTRWHEQDLTGYIKDTEKVIEIESWEQLENADPDVWYSINFEALKMSIKTEIDNRDEGAPLYSERHSQRSLEQRRARMTRYDSGFWDSLYMGNPKPAAGLLYGQGFKTYSELIRKENIREVIAYTDVAEKPGRDFLCSVVVVVGIDNYMYLLDVVYTNQGEEISSDMVIEMIIRNKVQTAFFEGNAAGSMYAKQIKRLLYERKWKHTNIETFHQKLNKEQRIISKAGEVMRLLLMPEGWTNKFPFFSAAIMGFKKLFNANKNDDGPDGITGAYIKSGLPELTDPDYDDYIGEWV